MNQKLNSPTVKSISSRIYWLAQISFWTLYFIVFVGLTSKDNVAEAAVFNKIAYLWPLLYCFFGLPISSLMKLVIDNYLGDWPSRLRITLFVLGLPIIASNFWFLWEVLLDKAFAEFGFQINKMRFSYYLKQMILDSLLLIIWTGIYLVFKYWSAYQGEKYRAEKAILLAENAQLKMLRYQLNPHFLFNALGSTRALIRQDQKKAILMVSKISEFLRYSLTEKMENLIKLEDEFEAAKNYIEIEQIQYGDKILFEQILDPDISDIQVPAFLIHPLIENAVKYGINTSEMPLKILLSAMRNNGDIQIEITNTGKWVNNLDKQSGTGTGINNVRERLDNKYPGNHELKITKGENLVRIEIKIRNNGSF